MIENFTGMSHDERPRRGGSLRLKGLQTSRLVISAAGDLDHGIVENLTILDTEPSRLRSISSGFFGVLPTLDLGIPGDGMVATPGSRKGPHRHYENAYVRVSVTTRLFLPTLRIEFKPYALLTLDPDGLEALRAAVSERFLTQEREVKISQVGVAVDLLAIGFVPPSRAEVVTRARLVKPSGNPRLASPTFGSPSGGVTFGLYDHTALRSPEEDWLSAVRRPVHTPPKGLRVWRAELTYHRPAIRELGLNGVGSRRTRTIETVPALAGRTADLLSPTLDEHDPWIRVVREPTEIMPLGIVEAPWWETVREAFLEGGSVGISAASMFSTTGGNGRARPHRLVRLVTLLSPGRH